MMAGFSNYCEYC